MFDVKALRHEMLDANCSVAELSKVCGISRATMYRRFKGDAYFTLGEIFACSERLNLSNQRRNEIFFGKSS